MGFTPASWAQGGVPSEAPGETGWAELGVRWGAVLTQPLHPMPQASALLTPGHTGPGIQSEIGKTGDSKHTAWQQEPRPKFNGERGGIRDSCRAWEGWERLLGEGPGRS